MNKKELIKDLKTIIEPIVGCYSEIGSFGNHDSCHGTSISWFELFCRSAYGVISYTKASGDNHYLDCFIKTLLKVVEEKQYSHFHDYDQKAVEFVPVATLLLLFRDVTWDMFTKEQKESVERYLLNINRVELCNNNWMLFRILVCSILQELTNKDYSEIINIDWKAIDDYYQGDGWYRDGKEGPKDYYNAFGFHFYSLLYYYLFKDNKRGEIIKERAILFAKDFFLFYDNEGRSIPFGRSLIYRYAPLSFWSMMLVNGLLNKEDESRAALIITNNYSWWKKQNIYDQQEFQNLGYAYPNRYMLESYNSSGSVYWSLKFFTVLLCDESAQIWKEMREMIASNKGTYIIANGDISIRITDQGNIAFINSYNGSGQTQDFAKYMHFAYHSATGFNINKCNTNFVQLSDDSSLIFDIDGRKQMRSSNSYYSITNSRIQTFMWNVGDIIDVVSSVVSLEDYYIRIHIIRSKKVCSCYETGFAIKKNDVGIFNTQGCFSSVDNKEFNSFIFMLRGSGEMSVLANEDYSNIYYQETVMPFIKYNITKGTSTIVDVTGLTNTDCSFDHIYEIITQKIDISKALLTIKDEDAFLKIPLTISKRVLLTLFCIKTRKHLQIIKADLKKAVYRLIKR